MDGEYSVRGLGTAMLVSCAQRAGARTAGGGGGVHKGCVSCICTHLLYALQAPEVIEHKPYDEKADGVCCCDVPRQRQLQ